MIAEEKRFPLCGVPVDDFPDADAAIVRIERLAFGDSPDSLLQVNFVNAHVVNVALANPDFFSVLSGDRTLNLVDGVGVWMGGKILRGIDLTNLNGTDFGLRLLEWGASKGLKFYFLGAREGIAEIAKEKLRVRIPGLRVVGTHDGYLTPETSADVLREMRTLETDILFVCMGVPGQEIWLNRHRAQLDGVKAAFCLGAFFDFYADKVKRAPGWMRKVRLEWVFRLCQEPRRLWRRYILGNVVFLAHVLKYKRGSARINRS